MTLIDGAATAAVVGPRDGLRDARLVEEVVAVDDSSTDAVHVAAAVLDRTPFIVASPGGQP